MYVSAQILGGKLSTLTGLKSSALLTPAHSTPPRQYSFDNAMAASATTAHSTALPVPKTNAPTLVVSSSTEDPYGGVLATNYAVRAVMEELAAFCVQTAQAQQKP